MKNPSSLSRIELLILLSMNNEICHGYEIMQRVEALSEGKQKLGAGTLYVALKRLVDNGLLAEDIAQRTVRSRFYKVTPSGKTAIDDKLTGYQAIIGWASQKGWTV